MKKLSITSILFLMCAVSAMATDHITWLSKVHDFGAFDEDTKQKTAYFSFVNTTDEPVSIVSATATCGCTVPKYSQKPVAPGDTATIEVSYDPSGRPGRFDKQVYVRTSDDLDRTKLIIRGVVIGNAETIKGRYPMSMGPLKLRNGAVMIGKAYAGRTKLSYLDGYNMSADSITPTVVYEPQWAKVKSLPATVGAGEMMNFDIEFDGTACPQWGVITDSITIRPGASADVYSIPVVVIVEEDFSGWSAQMMADAPVAKLDTDKIDITDQLQAGMKPIKTSVTLTNGGKSPMYVRRVYSEDPGVTVWTSEPVVAAGESVKLNLIFDPTAHGDVVNARFNLITNDPTNPTQIIRIVGAK